VAAQSASVRPWADSDTGVIGQENSRRLNVFLTTRKIPAAYCCLSQSSGRPKVRTVYLSVFRADDYRHMWESSAKDIRNRLF